MVATPTKTTTKSPVEVVQEAFEARGQEITIRETNKSFDGNKTNRTTEIRTTNCPGPNHKNDDATASLGFWEVIDNDGKATVRFHCFCGCTRADILKALKINTKLIPGAPTQIAPKRPALTLIDIACYTGIDWRFLFNLGWTEGTALFHNKARSYREQGIIIPYRTRDGKEYETSKIRIRLEKGHDKDNRFLYTESDEPAIAYGLDQLHVAEKAGYLVIPEGETDYATLRYHDIPALALPGANMVRSTLRVEDVKNIPIIYVIQEKTDEAGKNFPYAVKLHLEQNGYTGQILRIPLRNLTGAKDPNALHKQIYIQLKGKLEGWVSDQEHKELKGRFKEVFDRCLKQAKPMDVDTGRAGQPSPDPIINKDIEQAIANKDAKALLKTVPVLATLSKFEYAAIKLDIKEVFRGIINLNDLDAAVNEAKKAAAAQNDDNLDMDSVAQVFKQRHYEDWRYDVESQSWRQWTGTHWQELEKSKNGKYEIDLLVKSIIHEFGFNIKSNGTLECAHRLAEGECRDTFFPQPNLINFKNGTLQIPELVMKPHDKDDGFIDCLDYDYDPTMKHPTIDKYLRETYCKKELDDNGQKIPDWHAIQALEAHIGLALMGDTAMHAFIISLGPTRSGKSTGMRLFNAGCGIKVPGARTVEEMYGSFAGDDIFLNELEGKRARYMRRHQRIVCADELSPEALKQEEMIKNMSAHSGVPMRGMNKDDVTNNAWIPKLILSTNNLPSYLDYSGAVKERVVFVHSPFTLAKEDRDPRLLAKMLKEWPGFVHTCLEMGLKALERRYYPQSADMKLLAKAAESNGNALKDFIEDCCILDPGAVTPGSLIYNKFMEYREANGHGRNYAQNTFTANLKNMNIGVHNNDGKATRIYDGSDGKPTKCLYGIRLRGVQEEAPEIKVVDDELLDPSFCNALVTHCNAPVTDMRYKIDSVSNGSTSQFTGINGRACNDVTQFSEKLVSYGIPTFEKDKKESLNGDVKGVGVISESLNSQNCVTSLQGPKNGTLSEPVERVDVCNALNTQSVTSALQTVTKSVTSAEKESHIALRNRLAKYMAQKFVRTRPIWEVAGTPFQDGVISVDEYLQRIDSIIENGDPSQIKAVVNDMRVYLKEA